MTMMPTYPSSGSPTLVHLSFTVLPHSGCCVHFSSAYVLKIINLVRKKRMDFVKKKKRKKKEKERRKKIGKLKTSPSRKRINLLELISNHANENLILHNEENISIFSVYWTVQGCRK